ncbi:serine hydrolase domain-containing protein [Nocardioides marmotae]|uniref:serine hydrolase domain-containing protein n=1 Tax=Nocardioides marmotae TaxID=2663857 RepID=UPI001320B953|nr:serine hydrolase domain-containing protein [Nocardioides marmotae]MBC9733956.1 beta-lactamase family protein [Nocardioides marmotae]MTB85059.1 serine hydrolase [Nocardioides marmotae]
MSSPVGDTTAHRLLGHLARVQTAGRLPSVTAGVVRDGALAWSGTYGTPAVPGHDPADVQHRIGSITKTLTAVLVLQLVDEGRLDLDAPIRAVLGEVPYADRSARQLLAHASGITAEPAGEWWERSAGVTFEELLARHAAEPAVTSPGSRFHYSNLGYALLGEVVARLRGRPWADCVAERVLAPLGMTRTSYLPTGPAAQGWSVDPYTRELVPEPATDTRAMAPAGQLWSTVADLATYAAFLIEGHPDVLDASWLELAAVPQAGSAGDALAAAQGLGLQLLRGGSGTLVGHGGSMPGFLAACFTDRPRRTAAVVLAPATTGFSPTDLARALLEELEACEPALPRPWRPTDAVPAALDGVLGTWHWGNTPLVLALTGGPGGGEVVATGPGGAEKWRFAVVDGRIVGTGGYHHGEELHVVRRADGSISHLEVATFVLTRTPYDPDAPAPGGHPGR